MDYIYSAEEVCEAREACEVYEQMYANGDKFTYDEVIDWSCCEEIVVQANKQGR